MAIKQSKTDQVYRASTSAPVNIAVVKYDILLLAHLHVYAQP